MRGEIKSSTYWVFSLLAKKLSTDGGGNLVRVYQIDCRMGSILSEIKVKISTTDGKEE